MMSNQMKLGVAVAGAALLLLILWNTLQLSDYEYEVCMEFRGRSRCATAAAPNPEEAIRTGQQMACALITSGRDENILCLDTPPARVTPLREP
jgi:hypothetical protein